MSDICNGCGQPGLRFVTHVCPPPELSNRGVGIPEGFRDSRDLPGFWPSAAPKRPTPEVFFCDYEHCSGHAPPGCPGRPTPEEET